MRVSKSCFRTKEAFKGRTFMSSLRYQHQEISKGYKMSLKAQGALVWTHLIR